MNGFLPSCENWSRAMTPSAVSKSSKVSRAVAIPAAGLLIGTRFTSGQRFLSSVE